MSDSSGVDLGGKGQRPTDWHGREKKHEDQKIPAELIRQSPAIAAILIAIPGLIQFVQGTPSRDEVRQMILSTPGPYLADKNDIHNRLGRLESREGENARVNSQFAQSIAVMSTQLTSIASEVQALRKEIGEMKDRWWWTPPKKPDGTGKSEPLGVAGRVAFLACLPGPLSASYKPLRPPWE